MKMRILLALAGVAVLSLAVAADDRVVTKTTKVGKQSITTFETLKPPSGPPPLFGKGDKVKPDPDKDKVQPDFGNAWAKAVVLDAKNWQCGRYFTDEEGRRWVLVYGAPYADKPGGLSGWLLQPENARLHFFTTTGRLFRICIPVVQPVPVNAEPAVVLLPRR
jgi:hypothetical protein